MHHIQDDLLRAYVQKSNSMSRILVDLGDPLFGGHLTAAHAAASGELLHPDVLHKIMFQHVPGEWSRAGKIRTTITEKGSGILRPLPQFIEPLTDYWWEHMVGGEEFRKEKGERRTEAFATLLHVWLICIARYEKGNGRVARLVFNMLCIHKGLQWQMGHGYDSARYYLLLRRIEEGVFKAAYPHVY